MSIKKKQQTASPGCHDQLRSKGSTATAAADQTGQGRAGLGCFLELLLCKHSNARLQELQKPLHL